MKDCLKVAAIYISIISFILMATIIFLHLHLYISGTCEEIREITPWMDIGRCMP